jgi:O-antigen chain-terminating methyltransferase
MTDNMIVIHDDQIDVEEIMRQIRANIARRKGQSEIDPVAISQELWESAIGDTIRFQQQIGGVPLTRYDCDIVPHDYVIDWRIPILGPIHSIVRRLINTEIRRYLDVSLSKQTRFNENVLRALHYLAQENHYLRQEIEELRSSSISKEE